MNPEKNTNSEIVLETDPQEVLFPKGFYSGSFRTQAARKDKDDLGIILSSVPAQAAAVYTTNLVQAAPLKVNQDHLQKPQASAVIVNSGNANAAALNDLENAYRMAARTARVFGLPVSDVLVGSTGVIGQELDIEAIEDGISSIQIVENGFLDFARAIMTTDTRLKTASVVFELDGRPVRISGVCKGSGMIHPNMATMLAFLLTDCAIEPALLQRALDKAVKKSFNRISVDGDTSTNDMVLLLANGLAGNERIEQKNKRYKLFKQALTVLMQALARMIAADGEGATRLIEARVFNARTTQQAETLARSIVSSSLFKAAVFGKDANWGRVLCAMGYSGADFDPDLVDIFLSQGDSRLLLCEQGKGVSFDEEAAAAMMGADEILVEVDLHQGTKEASCYGCDLSDTYVYINSDYRS